MNRIGDLVLLPREEAVGLIIGFISDEWSDRYIVFSRDEVYEITWFEAVCGSQNEDWRSS